MKSYKAVISIFCLLLMIFTFTTSCEKEIPVQDGFHSEGSVLKYYKNGSPLTFPAGIHSIEGKPYFIEMDKMSICALENTLARKGDLLLYFTDDSSLQSFEAGFVDLPDGTYYADENGFALFSETEVVRNIGGDLYAFDENSRVMEFPAGVHDVFGKLYFVSEDGAKIDIPKEGLFFLPEGLYYVTADGTMAADQAEGYLTFGTDGRYTSGSEVLDQQVEALLSAVGADGKDPIEDFRLCYTYIRDNYTYLSMEHYPAGTNDWAQKCAETFFSEGKGNCYCWASAVMYCARRLGIQAYCVAGWERDPSNDHAWVMAEIDGTEYLFDAELEYASMYMYGNGPVDMFMTTGSYGVYKGSRYYFPEN